MWSTPAATYVETQVRAARAAFCIGDEVNIASEAGVACGVLAAFPHVIEGETHHEDYGQWIETSVQKGLQAWAENKAERGGE